MIPKSLPVLKVVLRDKYLGIEELNKILQEEISGLLSETNTGEATEFVIQKIKTIRFNGSGVNGVGKTTTIGSVPI
jgi:fused signal recognition particle receptor